MALPKPLLAVLDGVRIDPPPVWLMHQAGQAGRFLQEYRALHAKVSTVLDLAQIGVCRPGTAYAPKFKEATCGRWLLPSCIC